MMETETRPAGNEMFFDDIDTTDVLLIRTLNSLYRFSITDPATRCGVLIGGDFGDCPTSALLCGTSELRVGRCALFFVESGDQYKLLKTSMITDLAHVKSV